MYTSNEWINFSGTKLLFASFYVLFFYQFLDIVNVALKRLERDHRLFMKKDKRSVHQS